MDINTMRSYVSNAYNSSNWVEKVKWMADKQVVAIYFSLKERGKLNKKKKSNVINDGVQISIWDILEEGN